MVRENESEGIKLATMEVIYDYGFHIQDKLTALIGDSLFFFDYRDYDITHFFAGDLFEIYYKGVLLKQDSYPSTVVTDNLTIVDVLRLPSRVIEGTLLGVPGSSLYNFVGANYANHVYPEYVVNSDFTYEPVSNFHDEKVYASFRRDDQSEEPTITALFSFNPLSIWPPVLE